MFWRRRGDQPQAVMSPTFCPSTMIGSHANPMGQMAGQKNLHVTCLIDARNGGHTTHASREALFFRQIGRSTNALTTSKLAKLLVNGKVI